MKCHNENLDLMMRTTLIHNHAKNFELILISVVSKMSWLAKSLSIDWSRGRVITCLVVGFATRVKALTREENLTVHLGWIQSKPLTHWARVLENLRFGRIKRSEGDGSVVMVYVLSEYTNKWRHNIMFMYKAVYGHEDNNCIEMCFKIHNQSKIKK